MDLKRTKFFDKHVASGAKIVPFAGYEMPVQYPLGIIKEHMKVRESVGVFDVSHMGEVIVKGENALAYLQKITVNDVSTLVDGQAHYSCMCYEDGGIVDDLLVYKMPEHYLLVINASNIDKDFAWMQKNIIDGAIVENVSDSYSQLAVQGKDAETVLQKLTDVNLSEIKYYHFVEGELAGVNMILSRTGYTGEPGFEIYFDNSYSSDVWDKLFEAGKEFDMQPIGLGARDSLRLEKRMALYGNDIDQSTNPIEAGLAWITKVDKGDFIGRDVIVKVKEEKPKRRLVAIKFSDSKAFPRAGYPVVDEAGNEIGKVTSGTISPVLGVGIAMAYVPTELSAIDSVVQVQVRKNVFKATVIKGAFI